MRTKLLFWVMFVITTFLGKAQDVDLIKVTLDIDDASRVKVSVMGDELDQLVDGVNTIEVNPWSNLQIEAADGCILKSVTNGDGQEVDITDNTSANIFITDSEPEVSFTIISERSAGISFTLTVDNASKVSVMDKNYTPISISDGVNELTVSPLVLPLIIGPANYGESIYSVTLDGKEVPYNYGYAVSPEEGSSIVITVAFPDIDCTVSFTATEGISNFFTAVTVNGENVDFINGVTVKCGDKVALYYNQACWLNDDDNQLTVTINGEAPSWFGPGYSFVVKEDTDINVEQALAAPMISVIVSVDEPKNIIVYRCSEYYKDVISLSIGENYVTLPEDDSRLTIVAIDDNCKIKGVTVNNIPEDIDADNYCEVYNLDEGDHVHIFSDEYTAIAETEVESIFDVYTITGIPIMMSVDGGALNSLTSGLYIINGKKVMIK